MLTPLLPQWFLSVFILVIDKIEVFGDFWGAFEHINQTMIRNDGKGLLYFIGLFLFGLVVSFSPARKEGRSATSRWIEILESRGKKKEIAEE